MADIMIEELSEWRYQATAEGRIGIACWSKCSSRKSSLPGFLTSYMYAWNSTWRGKHSALQWRHPLHPRFCFSKDLKHFWRTLLSLTSNLDYKSSQLPMLSWVFSWVTDFVFGQPGRKINVKLIANYWNWHWCSLEFHHEHYSLVNLVPCTDRGNIYVGLENLPAQRRWI